MCYQTLGLLFIREERRSSILSAWYERVSDSITFRRKERREMSPFCFLVTIFLLWPISTSFFITRRLPRYAKIAFFFIFFRSCAVSPSTLRRSKAPPSNLPREISIVLGKTRTTSTFHRVFDWISPSKMRNRRGNLLLVQIPYLKCQVWIVHSRSTIVVVVVKPKQCTTTTTIVDREIFLTN